MPIRQASEQAHPNAADSTVVAAAPVTYCAVVATGTSAKNRSTGIDAARFIAVCGIPFIHVEHVAPLNTAIDLAFRFAVPFFFVVAGYFLSTKPLIEAASKQALRLGVPFAVWLTAYFIASGRPLSSITSVGDFVRLLIYGGPGYHLWFLPSLGILSILLLSMRRLPWVVLFALGVGVLVLAVLLGAYCKPIFGTSGLCAVPVRPLLGFPFLIAGYYLAVHRPSYPVWLAALLFIGGGLLQAAEAFGLLSLDRTVNYDVLVGTVPFGIGAFMLALKIPSTEVTRRLGLLGRYSLGIYAAHLIGLWTAYRVLPPTSFSATMFDALLALVFAILLSLLLRIWKPARILVA